MKLRIAYCDDETVARQIFDVGILDAFSRQNVNAALADYADPLQLAAVLREGAVFDVVFLDIDMPGLDGISLAKLLTAQEPAPAIFFSPTRMSWCSVPCRSGRSAHHRVHRAPPHGPRPGLDRRADR